MAEEKTYSNLGELAELLMSKPVNQQDNKPIHIEGLKVCLYDDTKKSPSLQFSFPFSLEHVKGDSDYAHIRIRSQAKDFTMIFSTDSEWFHEAFTDSDNVRRQYVSLVESRTNPLELRIYNN